ncbi:hypothetical protein EK21DRAFT_114113 [Setomelanomma holmii]|uniref:Carboxylic ester hydrolase n=1 Tax=Setomelanomma holmii TaxID=210430 RepID=A0A9P4LLP5_9PLEO|nr:hypothetical protein EK21DRAFT_114113 [Setomelanomma holmii]
MSGAVAQGYATVTSNDGVSSACPSEGALLSPGNIDYFILNNFALVSLHDAALAAKSVVTSFHGHGPTYSYWSGCSKGGRQGMMFGNGIIPFRNLRYYYNTVKELDPDVHGFYRLFEVPGLQHCARGVGGYPAGTFDALVQWVENGIVSDALEAVSPTKRTTFFRKRM